MSSTILIIDSYPEMREVLRAILTRYGYRTLESGTIRQGRALLENETPDLIILDIYLPDGNSLRFCEELREISKIPLLFSSGRVKREDGSYISVDVDRFECYQAGGNGYLSKPYDLNELLAEVEVLLH